MVFVISTFGLSGVYVGLTVNLFCIIVGSLRIVICGDSRHCCPFTCIYFKDSSMCMKVKITDLSRAAPAFRVCRSVSSSKPCYILSKARCFY